MRRIDAGLFTVLLMALGSSLVAPAADAAPNGLRNYNARYHPLNSAGERVVEATINPSTYCQGSASTRRIAFEFIGTWDGSAPTWVRGIRIKNNSGGTFYLFDVTQTDAGGRFTVDGVSLVHGQSHYIGINRWIAGDSSTFHFGSSWFGSPCGLAGASSWKILY